MKPKQTGGPSLFSIILLAMILFFAGWVPAGPVLNGSGLNGLVLNGRVSIGPVLNGLVVNGPVATGPASNNPVNFGAAPANAATRQEPLSPSSAAYVINIPAKIIEAELKNLIASRPSAVKEISRFDMDPVRRLAVMAGVIEIPAGEIYPSENRPKDPTSSWEAISKRHDFLIALSFPSAKSMAVTGYARFKIVELKLDGHSYVGVADILSNFVSVFLREAGFARFILSKGAGDFDPENKIKGDAAAFLEKKGIILGNGAISVKLDFKQFEAFRKIVSLPNLRLWRFEPVRFSGQNAFRIDAGIGKPGKTWVSHVEARVKADRAALIQSRKKSYGAGSDIAALKADVARFVEKEKRRMDFPSGPEGMGEMATWAVGEMDRFNRRLESRARSTLTVKNPLFEAWPKKTWNGLVTDIQNDAVAFYTDLNRRITLEKAIAQGGRDSYDRPFMETLLSQRAIHQAVRYYRHVAVNGKRLFSSLHLVLAPQLPGAIVRGSVNLDIDYLLDLEDRGDDIDGDVIQKRVDRLLGGGVPFEAGVRFLMKDGNLLSLDLKYVSFFKGAKRITLSNHQRHGRFLFNFAKGLLVKSPASLAIAGSTPETAGADPAGPVSDAGAGNAAAKGAAAARPEFLKYGHMYTQRKTLIRQGDERMEIFLDTGDKTINIKLNPKIAARDIFGMKNEIQVWEFAPVYFKEMDQTFLKIAAGDGERSAEYVREITSGALKKDSRAFVGTGGKDGLLDLRIRVNLNEIQDIANKILAHIHEKEAGKVQAAIAQKQEGTHYLLKKIGLTALKNRLRMDVAFSRVAISKRWVINPNRWLKAPYRITRKDISVYADIEMRATTSKDARLFLENELLTQELLKLDISKAGFDVENPSLFESVMEHFLGETDFSGGVGGALKQFFVKIIAPYLNGSGEDEGNTEIAGFKINQFLKIFTGDREIYLQLNPRFASPAFDVALVYNQNKGGEPLGFLIDSRRRALVVDFTTHGAMPLADRAEFQDIARRADLEFKPYLDEKDPGALVKKLNRLTLFDRVFHNSDESKLSLFHRIKRGMNLYRSIADLTAESTDPLAEEASTGGQSRVSVTGSEIIYFLLAARALEKNTRRLLARLEGMGISKKVDYLDKFKGFEKRLREGVIAPLAEKYAADHQAVNAKMARRGPTDWNRPYYQEAAFSAAAWADMESKKP